MFLLFPQAMHTCCIRQQKCMLNHSLDLMRSKTSHVDCRSQRDKLPGAHQLYMIASAESKGTNTISQLRNYLIFESKAHVISKILQSRSTSMPRHYGPTSMHKRDAFILSLTFRYHKTNIKTAIATIQKSAVND